MCNLFTYNKILTIHFTINPSRFVIVVIKQILCLTSVSASMPKKITVILQKVSRIFSVSISDGTYCVCKMQTLRINRIREGMKRYPDKITLDKIPPCLLKTIHVHTHFLDVLLNKSPTHCGMIF